jgi:uncharacterized protein (UPF0276 family)
VGYTVSPQYSTEILNRVRDRSLAAANTLGLPLLLENGPQYFDMPGSTMSQFNFIRELCAQSPDTLLLLDIAHLAITCENKGLDPFASLDLLPLERVVEVHVSGTKRQSGIVWDDHGDRAPELVFQLLEELLCRIRPRAITMEYNWNARFPIEVLHEDLSRVRALLKNRVERRSNSSACRQMPN